MSLLVFPWDDIGYPTEMDVIEHAHVTTHPYSGGYSSSRPDGTKIQKSITMRWNAMTSAEWLELVEFWRSVGGPANAFYYEFIEIYGSPGYGGYGGLEPLDGFDADQDAGYGDGPIFTVRFVEANLPQRYRSGFNIWSVEATVREVA
jgi:hypothetical protein